MYVHGSKAGGVSDVNFYFINQAGVTLNTGWFTQSTVNEALPKNGMTGDLSNKPFLGYAM